MRPSAAADTSTVIFTGILSRNSIDRTGGGFSRKKMQWDHTKKRSSFIFSRLTSKPVSFVEFLELDLDSCRTNF